VLCLGTVIEADEVKRELSGASPFVTEAPEHAATRAERPASAARPAPPSRAADGEVRPLEEQLHAAERRALAHALAVARGNRSKAARLLGVGRQTLYNMLKEHGLQIPSDA
jgi:DNA-binding NtrC family response regulator